MSTKQKVVWSAVIWQAVLYPFIIGGAFGVIFKLLGIPWNSVGWPNILGTTLGWVILESPVLILLAWFYISRRKKELNSTRQP